MPGVGRRDIELRLRVEQANGEVATVSVEKGPINIGRGSDCAIVVDNHAVSRNHCVLFPLAGALHLKDLRSANGTLVNGELATYRILAADDVVQVGDTQITVQVSERGGGEERAPSAISLSDALSVLLRGSKDLSASAKAAVGFLQELVSAERSFILLASESQRGRLPVLASARAEGASKPAPEGVMQTRW